MFCPVCESEYGPGISRCPDDESELVEKLNPETSQDDSEANFVPLHTFGSPPEAEMVNDLLRQSGIRTAVQSGPQDTLSPLLSSVGLGASVLVDERDYDKAAEIYEAFFGGDETPLTGGEGLSDDEDEEDK
jgi:Putative prokaryotic signal transducing protein